MRSINVYKKSMNISNIIWVIHTCVFRVVWGIFFQKNLKENRNLNEPKFIKEFKDNNNQ